MTLLNALSFWTRPTPAEDALSTRERALLQRAQQNDGPAFQQLFERHAPAVHRFLYDLLRDPAEADEATQESFVRAHAKLQGLREHQKLLPWLLGIARNVAFEHHRARRRAPKGLEADGVVVQLATLATPETLLLGRETEQLLGTALARLPEERRCALLLRLDHGLAYEDIAATLGWSLPKVKNEIHRARLELRRALAEHLEVTP